MKVAIFTDTFPPDINGVATSSNTLRNILIKNGHEVLVVTSNPLSKKIMLEDGILRVPGITLKSLYEYNLANTINHNIDKYLYAFNPDVVHIQQEFTVSIAGRFYAKKAKKPVVYTYHTMYEDYSYYITKGHFDRIVRSFLRWVTRKFTSLSTEFISPSLKTNDYIRQVGSDDYISVIPTGIDFSIFDPKNVDKSAVQAIKDKYEIRNDEFVVISLGRIAKEKSIDICIDNVVYYKKEHPDVKIKFLIVGKGPIVDELKEQVKSLGAEDYIIFTGPCNPSEVQNYYSVADTFVCASISETQGLTYMEAMASHLYVLARYDQNLIDVIQEGKTGYFFESETEFAEKLEIIRQRKLNKDNKMLLDAIKGIDRYSIETFYKNIMEVYNRAIKKNWQGQCW